MSDDSGNAIKEVPGQQRGSNAGNGKIGQISFPVCSILPNDPVQMMLKRRHCNAKVFARVKYFSCVASITNSVLNFECYMN